MSTKPQQTASVIKPSGRMIYTILCGGSLYSVHDNAGEAEKYLEDLKLVKHNEEWDLQSYNAGRLDGRPIWCSQGCYDLWAHELMNFRRLWSFKTEEVPDLKIGDKVSRFLWLTLDTTDEHKFQARVKKFKKLNCRLLPPDDTVEILDVVS